MSDAMSRTAAAEQALIASCTVLALRTVAGVDDRTWLDIIGDVLPACRRGGALEGIRFSAERLVSAGCHHARVTARGDLQVELRAYFERSAVRRHTAIREAAST